MVFSIEQLSGSSFQGTRNLRQQAAPFLLFPLDLRAIIEAFISLGAVLWDFLQTIKGSIAPVVSIVIPVTAQVLYKRGVL